MQTDRQVERHIALARSYVDQRRFDAAERVCEQILKASDDEPYALRYLASHAIEKGNPERAVALADRLCRAQPNHESHRILAQALRTQGDEKGAVKALRQAIGLAPEEALLYAELAVLLDEVGRTEDAARCMTKAFILDQSLTDARRNPNMPMPLRKLSQRGDNLLQGFHYGANRALAKQLEEEHDGRLPDRWWLFLDRVHRRAPMVYANPLQRPDYHYYEGIRAQPFWPREQFSWLDEVEAAAETIRAEFLAVMDDKSSFEPYVHANESAPEEWKRMSGRLDWASFHLLRGNRPVEENCRRCPRTAALMERVPMARITGHAPEVFFSVLEPGTHIPPHYGVSNTKLAIHLPLIIPPDCAIRVGEQTRGWEELRCMIFDDSFLHEAWNRSDQTRVVLIFETWNPDLSDLERRCVTGIVERGESWYQSSRKFTIDQLPS